MIDPIDAFWARQERLPIPQARPVVCVVCERRGAPDSTRRALCVHCGRDVAAMRGHVASVMWAAEERASRAWAVLEARIPDDPDHPLRLRWDAYQSALDSPRAKATEQAADRPSDDPLFVLVRLWLDYRAAADAYTDRLAWERRCEEALQ